MLLSDSELLQLLTDHPNLITNLDLGIDPYDKSSPLQPGSIDLSIGSIFLPETKRFEYGGVLQPRQEYFLRTGETAVVETLQRLNFPNDIEAFGFPPSSVSSQGLLMTNPGHIDPGYLGTLRFTVINMGQEPFLLKHGDRIVTLLVCRLTTPARRGYHERHRPARLSGVSPEQLLRLSADFLNVEKRAEEVAKRAEREARLLSVWLPFFGVIIAIIAIVVPILVSMNSQISALKGKIAILEHTQIVKDHEERIQVLEEKVNLSK